jgi:Flp pilus assembly protein TadG
VIPTRGRDRGQATVELALALPFLCVLLLAVVQVAVVARDRVAVQLAAREAARAASVTPDLRSATAAAERAIGLRPLRVEVSEAAGLVQVRVSYTDPTDVPLVGAVLPDVEVSASVAMAVEPPDPHR